MARGPAARLGSTVDQRQCGQNVWWCGAGVRRLSARGHRCSSAMAGEDEEDVARPIVSSPEHER
jgi:hypothetical protein